MSTRQNRIGLGRTIILWAAVAVGLPIMAAGRLSAADAFAPLRLGEVTPDGWLHAVLLRDRVSGYQGHLDALLEEPKTGRRLLQPEHNDFVT